MNARLQTTISVLETTRNDAAAPVLFALLGQAAADLRKRAFLALLRRRVGLSQEEILRHWHTLDDELKSLVASHPARLAAAIQHGLESSDAQICENALDVAAWSCCYEVIPALVRLSQQRDFPQRETAAETLLELAEEMHEELSGDSDAFDRRNPDAIRRQVVAALEQTLNGLREDAAREHLESFLMLANRENEAFQGIVKDPHQPHRPLTLELFFHSSKPGIIRLLLSHLNDRRAPDVLLEAISRRTDKTFLRRLFEKFANETIEPEESCLSSIEAFAWLNNNVEVVDDCDGEHQAAAIRLVLASGVERQAAFELLRRVLLHGHPPGRREATQALREFGGAESDLLLLQALEDSDPEVQIAAIEQVGSRELPEATPVLLNLLDSPHASVRETARINLAEFNMKRFLSLYDTLDAENRVMMAELVQRIDLDYTSVLTRELNCGVRTRVIRALEIVKLIGITTDLEDTIIPLLDAEDHFVRGSATDTLASALSEDARQDLLQQAKPDDQNAAADGPAGQAPMAGGPEGALPQADLVSDQASQMEY